MSLTNIIKNLIILIKDQYGYIIINITNPAKEMKNAVNFTWII